MTDTFRDRFNLFLCSFTILFVELTCIRWIPSYIRYLGYFTNFVLLASFLGIGLGILQARRRVDLHTFFPATLAVLVAIVATFKLQLNVTSGQEVFFQDGVIKAQGTEAFFLVPLVFILVGAIFALLGQNLGRLLTAVRPPPDGLHARRGRLHRGLGPLRAHLLPERPARRLVHHRGPRRAGATAAARRLPRGQRGHFARRGRVGHPPGPLLAVVALLPH